MQKRLVAVLVVVAAAVAGLMIRQRSVKSLPEVTPAIPPTALNFFLTARPTATQVRIGVDEPVELTVRISQPAHIYVLDSHESSRPTLVWEPAPDGQKFEAGEYASEGLTLSVGAHKLTAVAAPALVPALATVETLEADAISQVCPECSVRQLELTRTGNKLSSIDVAPEEPPEPAEAKKGGK